MKKTILASMLAVMMATPAFAAESTDIVIIGSGGAGLSSAITATEKGAPRLSCLRRWPTSAATRTAPKAA